jgi:hypothetical protein
MYVTAKDENKPPPQVAKYSSNEQKPPSTCSTSSTTSPFSYSIFSSNSTALTSYGHNPTIEAFTGPDDKFHENKIWDECKDAENQDSAPTTLRICHKVTGQDMNWTYHGTAPLQAEGKTTAAVPYDTLESSSAPTSDSKSTGETIININRTGTHTGKHTGAH